MFFIFQAELAASLVSDMKAGNTIDTKKITGAEKDLALWRDPTDRNRTLLMHLSGNPKTSVTLLDTFEQLPASSLNDWIKAKDVEDQSCLDYAAIYNNPNFLKAMLEEGDGKVINIVTCIDFVS